jgi:hypothetical protein
MKCFDCDQQIEGQAIMQTRGRDTTLWSLGERRGFEVTICSECAKRRRRMPLFVFFVFCFAFGMVGLIAFILHW